MVAPNPLSAVFRAATARPRLIDVWGSGGKSTAGKSVNFGVRFLHFVRGMPYLGHGDHHRELLRDSEERAWLHSLFKQPFSLPPPPASAGGTFFTSILGTSTPAPHRRPESRFKHAEGPRIGRSACPERTPPSAINPLGTALIGVSGVTNHESGCYQPPCGIGSLPPCPTTDFSIWR
jgi:hypothetical protein